MTWIGSTANGIGRVQRSSAPWSGEPAALGVIWSNVIPESCASWFSCSITFGVSSCFGIAFARLKTLAERTAGSAFMKPVERLLAICFCTAAVCFFRLAALARFGAIRAK